MGAAVTAARGYLLGLLASLGVNAVLVVSLTVLAFDQRAVVHVADVSAEGQVVQVRIADGRWTPTRTQITHHLGRFVRLVRAIPMDDVVLGENWHEAYRFLTPQAAARMTDLANRDDPMLSLGRVARTVHVSLIQERSDGTWEVTWVERPTNETGTSDGEIYSGLFKIAIQPPRTADDIMANPLGIRISEFSWSRQR